MPLYNFKCAKTGTVFQRFGPIHSTTWDCPCCNQPALKIISKPAFVPPEGDLTYIANRDRMAKGLYHDQDAAHDRQSKEKNDEMRDSNARMMGRSGFTEKVDSYRRKDAR